MAILFSAYTDTLLCEILFTYIFYFSYRRFFAIRFQNLPIKPCRPHVKSFYNTSSVPNTFLGFSLHFIPIGLRPYLCICIYVKKIR
jgi:hypothetical protein